MECQWTGRGRAVDRQRRAVDCQRIANGSALERQWTRCGIVRILTRLALRPEAMAWQGGGLQASTSAAPSPTCSCTSRRRRSACASPRSRPRPATRPTACLAPSRGRRHGRRARPHRPRHDHHHQCAAGAQGRQGRPHHHARLPRRARARPPHAAPRLRHDRHLRAPDPARSPARGRRAHRRARARCCAPLDEDGVRGGRAALLAARAARALVIHFLHSYANPAHERARRRDRRASCGRTATSPWATTLFSEFREFERGVTASVNAAVQPILDRYVERLRGELAAQGSRRDFLIMKAMAARCRRASPREAAKTVMSGPASGVMAAADTGRRRASPTSSPTTWAAPRPTSR